MCGWVGDGWAMAAGAASARRSSALNTDCVDHDGTAQDMGGLRIARFSLQRERNCVSEYRSWQPRPRRHCDGRVSRRAGGQAGRLTGDDNLAAVTRSTDSLPALHASHYNENRLREPGGFFLACLLLLVHHFSRRGPSFWPLDRWRGQPDRFPLLVHVLNVYKSRPALGGGLGYTLGCKAAGRLSACGGGSGGAGLLLEC